MAQIIRITSEALQSTIRRLLPSQQGFGEDLQASNVIMPVIDVTPTAEGSQTRQDLQTAMSFGSQTTLTKASGLTDQITTPGFFRVQGAATVRVDGTTAKEATFILSDGTTDKNVWGIFSTNGINNEIIVQDFDFVIFLATGEKLRTQADAAANITGSFRQIATTTGTLVNPSGFNPQ